MGGGGTAVTFLKMACGLHTAALLLFLYRIRVRRAGNTHLLNSVWPVADVSKSRSEKLKASKARPKNPMYCYIHEKQCFYTSHPI